MLKRADGHVMTASKSSPRPVSAHLPGSLAAARPRLAVAVGAVAVSATAIFVALAGSQPGTASFYRCVLALPFLLPLAWRDGRGTARPGRRALIAAIVAGVLFAADMLLWTQAIFDVG